MKNKIMLKAMYVGTLVLLICPSLMANKVKSPRTTPGTAIFVMAHQSTVSTQSKQLDYNNYGLKLTMQVPQLDGLKNSKFEKKINNQLMKAAKERKSEVIKEAIAYNKEIIRDGLSPIPFEYIENYSVIPSVNPYYTIGLFKYQYSGGAHGINHVDYMTINTETSKVVELKDLFKENVNYKTIINDLITKQIEVRTQAGEAFFTGSDGFKSIKENQPFFINQNGDLVIVFNVYEIASYASGTQFFTLPYKELLPYMK